MQKLYMYYTANETLTSIPIVGANNVNGTVKSDCYRKYGGPEGSTQIQIPQHEYKFSQHKYKFHNTNTSRHNTNTNFTTQIQVFTTQMQIPQHKY